MDSGIRERAANRSRLVRVVVLASVVLIATAFGAGPVAAAETPDWDGWIGTVEVSLVRSHVFSDLHFNHERGANISWKVTLDRPGSQPATSVGMGSAAVVEVSNSISNGNVEDVCSSMVTWSGQDAFGPADMTITRYPTGEPGVDEVSVDYFPADEFSLLVSEHTLRFGPEGCANDDDTRTVSWDLFRPIITAYNQRDPLRVKDSFDSGPIPCGPGCTETVTWSVDLRRGISPECSDGRDNDGDALVDWPDDDGCESSGDPSEADKYAVEIRAWIPFAHIVDPHKPHVFGHNSRLRPDEECLASADRPRGGTVQSAYRGDEHRVFDGSYRVRSAASFVWDGHAITDYVVEGGFGTTHRDLIYRFGKETRACTINTGTATEGFWGAGGVTKFNLGFSSANPLVTGSPAIDATIVGAMADDGTMTIAWSSDRFPNHGIRVKRNGRLLSTKVIDVGCFSEHQMLSPSGLAFITLGLSGEPLPNASMIISPSDTGFEHFEFSALCGRG